jgi:hypothetical protein
MNSVERTGNLLDFGSEEHVTKLRNHGSAEQQLQTTGFNQRQNGKRRTARNRRMKKDYAIKNAPWPIRIRHSRPLSGVDGATRPVALRETLDLRFRDTVSFREVMDRSQKFSERRGRTRRRDGAFDQFSHILVTIHSDLARPPIEEGEQFVADSCNFDGALHSFTFIIVQRDRQIVLPSALNAAYTALRNDSSSAGRGVESDGDRTSSASGFMSRTESKYSFSLVRSAGPRVPARRAACCATESRMLPVFFASAIRCAAPPPSPNRAFKYDVRMGLSLKNARSGRWRRSEIGARGASPRTPRCVDRDDSHFSRQTSRRSRRSSSRVLIRGVATAKSLRPEALYECCTNRVALMRLWRCRRF